MRKSIFACTTAAIFGLALVQGSGPVYAGTITHFSHALSLVQADSTGASTIEEILSDEYFAKGFNRDGSNVNTGRSFDGPEGTSATSGNADLSSGALRAGASATASGAGGWFSAFSRADVGDGFTTYQGLTPYQWQPGDTGTFSIDLSGVNNATSHSQVISDAHFFLYIFQPGTIDAYGRWLAGSDGSAFDEWQAGILETHSYALGALSDRSFGETLVEGFPRRLDIDVAPGGNFDWAAGLVTSAHINGSFAPADAFVLLDFTSTALLSYQGPAGTQTVSASGLFPETLVAPVPVPPALPMLAAGLFLLARVARRGAA